MAVNTIKAYHKGGTHFTADINGYKIEIGTDDPKEGKAAANTRPKVLMLVSLAGCTAFDVVSILDKMRVEYSDFSVGVEGNLTEPANENEPKVYDAFTIVYSIKVKKEDEHRVQKAVKLSKEKYCGVSKMLEKIGPITYRILYL
jgi:putative redox protein